MPAARVALDALRPGLPVVLAPEEGGTVCAHPLDVVLDEALRRVREAGRPARVLGDLLDRLLRRMARRVRDETDTSLVAKVASEQAAALISDMALGGDTGASLAEDLAALVSALPEEGSLVGPNVPPVGLAVHCLRLAREPARQRILSEAAALAEGLDDLLRLDGGRGSGTGLKRSVQAGLGPVGGRLVDAAALAKLHPDRNASRLDPKRRKRLQAVRDHLRTWSAEAAAAPLSIHLVARPTSGVGQDVPNADVSHHPRPLEAAAEVFLEAAAPIVALARALRIARLEVSGRYQPRVHDDAITGLDWQALTPEELYLVPPVIVAMDEGDASAADLGDLCRLVWTGRPVLVLAARRVPSRDELSDLSRHQPALGPLVIALRHAWVLQGTVARPAPLAAGLLSADPCRPGVVLLARAGSAVEAEVAVAGRAWPLFTYRPAGTGGEPSLGLMENPDPARDWPSYTLEGDEDEGPEVTVTFADVAAADPAGQAHLLPLAVETDDDELVPVTEWLSHPDRDRATGPLPFIWLVREDGSLLRAVVSRALALACGDRLDAYRWLQEVAGVAGAGLNRAGEAARAAAMAEAATERARLEAERDAAVATAARDAAREAMSRLASALLADTPGIVLDSVNGKGGPAHPVTPIQEKVTATIAEAPAQQKEAPPEEVSDDDLLDAAWIDTPACTSCNDCIQINAKLFVYDDNKQIVFGDPSAGTYAELVRAAEVCPANCIHPGRPSPGDPTATPELVERGTAI